MKRAFSLTRAFVLSLISPLALASFLCCATPAHAQRTLAQAFSPEVDAVTAAKWGLLGQLAGKNFGFGTEGFATYRWLKPGQTLIGTVRTFAGTYQTVYVLRSDGTIAGLRKLTETGESGDVAVTISSDRFSAADAGRRYSCVSKRSMLTCNDEVSLDRKQWTERGSLTAAEISPEQLRMAAAALPSGFPALKAGYFDPKLGAFEKLAKRIWLAPSLKDWHELRFSISGTKEEGSVSLGMFNLIGDSVGYYYVTSEKGQPLGRYINGVGNLNAGSFSSDGRSEIYLGGRTWRFSVSPDEHFALLEIFDGRNYKNSKTVFRQIYQAMAIPPAESKRWGSLSILFGNFYQKKIDYYSSFRWIGSGRILVNDYIAAMDSPYSMSYCVAELPDKYDGISKIPCIGKWADGSVRNAVFANLGINSFDYDGIKYFASELFGRTYFSTGKPDGHHFEYQSWEDVSAKKMAYDTEQTLIAANEKRREREQRQQADMQALYNGLSLAANRSMANAGMTSTTFDQTRTDWTSSGTPAPLQYDAGGVYGQATKDGSYYVGNGLSSKEVEAFQIREQIAAERSTGRTVASDGVSAAGVSVAAPRPAKVRGGTLRFFLQAGIAENREYWVKQWGKENTQTPMCFSHIYEFRDVPGYVAGIDRDDTVAQNIIEAQKDAFVLACAAHPVNVAPIHRDAISAAWNADGATGSSNSDESIDKAWHNLFDHHHAFVTPSTRSAPGYDDR